MKTSTNAKELRELNACEEGYKTFVAAHGENDATLSQCLESNGWDDVWWLIGATLDQFTDEQKHDLRVYGCKKALINIEKIKPYCSESDYDLIAGYLNNHTEEARSAAESAAWAAAESAARSAWAAESAAWAAARSAARSAAWAAARSAAWAAARSAAWAAAWAAAESSEEAFMEKNKKDLRDLFLKWESMV